MWLLLYLPDSFILILIVGSYFSWNVISVCLKSKGDNMRVCYTIISDSVVVVHGINVISLRSSTGFLIIAHIRGIYYVIHQHNFRRIITAKK